MILNNKSIADFGEDAAALFLLTLEYKIITRNYKRRFGEIDIVAEKDGILRFIEVKTSKYYKDSSFVPEVRVNARKIRNLRRICETYIYEHKIELDREWQIDVISVILGEKGEARDINHIENAIFESRY